jgi:hypothetical protein
LPSLKTTSWWRLWLSLSLAALAIATARLGVQACTCTPWPAPDLLSAAMLAHRLLAVLAHGRAEARIAKIEGPMEGD